MYSQGELYFIFLTSTRKNIIYLPPEIRLHILSFLNVYVKCIYCYYIFNLYPKNILHYKGYYSYNTNCICNQCKNYIFK